MTLKNYLLDRLKLYILHLICMMGAALYLHLAGLIFSAIFIFLAGWLLIVVGWTLLSYQAWRRHFLSIEAAAGHLEKKYLITEVIEHPAGLMEQFYFHLLRQAEKGMIEEVSAVRRSFHNYQEYLERWVHDVKSPLTSLQLKCSNDPAGTLLPVMPEIEEMENQVDQILFFARSENPETDCLIRPVVLKDIVKGAVDKNRHILMHAVSLTMEVSDDTVHTDSKWLEFVITQLLINAVKYRNPENGTLKIYSTDGDNYIGLCIEDNGIGILPSELPRVFDKGFTGTNGRLKKHSTGMGLYLCRQLLDRLGHTLTLSSVPHQGTAAEIRIYLGRS